MTTICVPTDNSEAAELSVEEGVALARLIDARVLAISVSADADDTMARDALDLALVLGTRHNVAVETRQVSGKPVKALLGVIQDVFDPLVMIGSSGKHGWDRFFGGSVSEGLIRKAGANIVVYGPQARRQFTSYRDRDLRARLMTTTDGSDLSRRGVHEALRWGQRLKAPVHVASVSPGPKEGEVAATIEWASAAGEANQTEVTSEIAEGPVVPTILGLAKERDVGMIVMSTHGRGMGSRLVGSTTREVFDQAEVPVMVVPPT